MIMQQNQSGKPYNEFTSHWFESCNEMQTEILLVRSWRGSLKSSMQGRKTSKWQLSLCVRDVAQVLTHPCIFAVNAE